MDYGIVGSEMELAKAMTGGSVQRENDLQQLINEQKRLEARLVEVKQGQEILREHPELVDLLKILAGRRF